jgi:hypothetical protein
LVGVTAPTMELNCRRTTTGTQHDGHRSTRQQQLTWRADNSGLFPLPHQLHSAAAGGQTLTMRAGMSACQLTKDTAARACRSRPRRADSHAPIPMTSRICTTAWHDTLMRGPRAAAAMAASPTARAASPGWCYCCRRLCRGCHSSTRVWILALH